MPRWNIIFQAIPLTSSYGEGRVTWRREFSSRFVRVLKMNGVGIKLIRFYVGEQVYKRLIRELQGENV